MGNQQEWEHQAAQVLRKMRRLRPDAPDADVWATLSAKTVEGVPVPPVGLPGRSAPADGRRRSGPGGWDNRPHIVDPDPGAAADAAFEEWQNDSTSIWLTVGGPGTDPAAVGRALGRIPLDMLPVVITAAGSTTEVLAAQALSDVLHGRGVTAAEGGSLGADPVGRLLRTGQESPGSAVDAVIRDVASMATDLAIGALVADGATAHLRGAGDAGEIGYALATGVHYLRELERCGYSLAQSLQLIHLRLAATDDQFATISKFRAARALWARIADLSGDADGWTPQIHAVTSTPMMTRYDPWTNLLRTTVATFAAGVGGADALTVQPFDAALGIPDAQGRRLARNISALLMQEAHVADVADPAGGSWAVETLTDAVADAAWTEFLLIEQEGGVIASIDDGSLGSRFAGTRARRTDRINTRSQTISGISEFPLSGEQLLPRQPYPGAPSGSGGLEERSWAADFEALRDEPMDDPVFLATLGPLAAHADRAGFAANALAAGGVRITPGGPTATVQDVLLAFEARSGAGDTAGTVVCLVGTDLAYAESAASVISALREAGACWFILAGRPSRDISDLLDDHIAIGDDVLAFLHRTRRALARPVPAGRGAKS